MPWEELLSRPLDDVRRELGIVPFLEDTSRWLEHSWFGRHAAVGFGAYPREAARAQVSRKIVEAGVSCPESLVPKFLGLGVRYFHGNVGTLIQTAGEAYLKQMRKPAS